MDASVLGALGYAVVVVEPSPGMAAAATARGVRVRPGRAEELLLLALAQNPREAAVLNNLGIARDLQGRHAEAQKSYGEAIAANPSMRAAQVNLALSMALSGQPDAAAFRELAVLLLPARSIDHLPDAFGKARRADLQPAGRE